MLRRMDLSNAKKLSGFHLALRLLLYAVLAWLTWLMLEITLNYWPVRDDAGFLQIKQQYLGIRHWEAAFWVHVFTSMLALGAGFTQFAPWVLRRWPKLHRWMGRLYVFNGGWTSRLAFGILAVGWITTTAMGWRMALRRQWLRHREWMMRSYALTLSALTLRVWKYTLVYLFEPRPMDLYRLVAWLGFVPNVLLVEWLIRRRRNSAAKIE